MSIAVLALDRPILSLDDKLRPISLRDTSANIHSILFSGSHSGRLVTALAPDRPTILMRRHPHISFLGHLLLPSHARSAASHSTLRA